MQRIYEERYSRLFRALDQRDMKQAEKLLISQEQTFTQFMDEYAPFETDHFDRNGLPEVEALQAMRIKESYSPGTQFEDKALDALLSDNYVLVNFGCSALKQSTSKAVIIRHNIKDSMNDEKAVALGNKEGLIVIYI